MKKLLRTIAPAIIMFIATTAFFLMSKEKLSDDEHHKTPIKIKDDKVQQLIIKEIPPLKEALNSTASYRQSSRKNKSVMIAGGKDDDHKSERERAKERIEQIHGVDPTESRVEIYPTNKNTHKYLAIIESYTTKEIDGKYIIVFDKEGNDIVERIPLDEDNDLETLSLIEDITSIIITSMMYQNNEETYFQENNSKAYKTEYEKAKDSIEQIHKIDPTENYVQMYRIDENTRGYLAVIKDHETNEAKAQYIITFDKGGNDIVEEVPLNKEAGKEWVLKKHILLKENENEDSVYKQGFSPKI